MDDLAAIRHGLLRLRSIIAAERFSRALYRHYLALKAGYRSDQLRDELGRWADEGRSRVRLAASGQPPLGPRARASLRLGIARRLINALRSKNGLRDLFGNPIGTVSVASIEGKAVYGSSARSGYYTREDLREAVALRDKLIAKYPDVMNTGNPGAMPNNVLFHSESNILMRAARENGGSLAGKAIEVFTDRPMCNNCPAVLPYVGLELGNPAVTFVGPSGATRTMQNGAWVRP